MKYESASGKLADLKREFKALRRQMIEVRRAAEPQPMKDYSFILSSGEQAGWKELFGQKDDLIVIHNMGRTCPYCTLWADGFNGVYDHLANRAAFALASPDTPEAQAKFAAARGWRFPMISYHGTSLAEDTGYGQNGSYYPGVSVFQKQDGQVLRVSNTSFEPGDLYCGVWHLLDLIPQGADGWQPKFSY